MSSPERIVACYLCSRRPAHNVHRRVCLVCIEEHDLGFVADTTGEAHERARRRSAGEPEPAVAKKPVPADLEEQPQKALEAVGDARPQAGSIAHKDGMIKSLTDLFEAIEAGNYSTTPDPAMVQGSSLDVKVS